jgi:hypothetical protein
MEHPFLKIGFVRSPPIVHSFLSDCIFVRLHRDYSVVGQRKRESPY